MWHIFLVSVPEAPPQNVRAAPESESSIRVSWEPVPKFKRKGNITGYNIEVRNNTNRIINRTICAENLTAVIEALEMFVTYHFKVQAFTEEGFGNFSPEVNATTKQSGKAPHAWLRTRHH